MIEEDDKAERQESGPPSFKDVHEDCKHQLKRLKDHLIELDKEMEAESLRHERERTQMMSKIEELEEKMLASQLTKEATNNNPALFDEIQSLRTENESLKSKLSHSETEAQNLRSSLELLETRVQDEVSERTSGLQLQIKKYQCEVANLRQKVERLEESIEGSEVALEVQKKLEKNIEANVRLIDQLNDEINILKGSVDRERLSDSKNPNGLVEKRLVANLITSYLSCPTSDRIRRVEILSLMADILCMDQEQRLMVGLEQHNALDEYAQPRLGELWTAFLLGKAASQE